MIKTKKPKIATIVFAGLLLPAFLSSSVSASPPPRKNISTNRLAALTFDDGPKPEFSIPLLNLLDKHHVRATFFVVGKEAQAHPDIIYRMHDSGHDIGNHSFSHFQMDKLTDKQIDLELGATSGTIESITRKKPVFFRPPGGRFNQLVLDYVKKHNLEMIMWDINSGDYTALKQGFHIKGDQIKNLAKDITHKVLTKAKPGSIILMHNGGTETLLALPKIIGGLRKKGFKFVTLTELKMHKAGPQD